MNKNLQKKLPQYTHRRVKTDLSTRNEQKQNNNIQIFNHLQTNRRYNTELKQSKIQKSSSNQKFNQESNTSRKNLLYNLSYNKWYIKPEIRMKRSLVNHIKFDGIDHQYVYNKLYEENTTKQDCPFMTIKNSKLKLLQKIPVHNLRLLQTFKRNQELNKKRVPKIIQLFLKRKGGIKLNNHDY